MTASGRSRLDHAEDRIVFSVVDDVSGAVLVEVGEEPMPEHLRLRKGGIVSEGATLPIHPGCGPPSAGGLPSGVTEGPSAQLADHLVELGAKPALVLAAERGLILNPLQCEMNKCWCPQGRFHFTMFDVGSPKSRLWSLSTDRFPVPARAGGKYTADNVRVAHFSCNSRDGATAYSSRSR